MDERFLQQLFAELIDAQENALAVMASALSDSVGPAFGEALAKRAAAAQAAKTHPMRDKLLASALRATKAH